MPFSLPSRIDPSRCDFPYEDWNEAEIQLRAHLLASDKGMTSWFKEQESRITTETFSNIDPSTLDGDEAYNAFMDEIGILWPTYWEMTASQIIRDAYRLYETFLFDSANLVLRRNGAHLKDYGTGLTWMVWQREMFYRQVLNIEITNDEVEAFHWIRNKLTHLDTIHGSDSDSKAKLENYRRTLGLDKPLSDDEKNLGLFHDDYDKFLGIQLRFTPVHTWRMLNTLRTHVNSFAPTLWELRWDSSKTTHGLTKVKNGMALSKENEKLIAR